MPASPQWSPRQAIGSLLVTPWTGSVWRAHRRRYNALDHGGSLLVSGRYHRGQDSFPDEQVFPALYLALTPEICLGEIIRHVTPATLARFNDYHLSEIRVSLTAVLDLRDSAPLRVPIDAVLDDTDYSVPQALAAAARERGAEGIIVPSATRLGDNLILFPDRLQAVSELVVVASREPRLYVERT
jgi:RES domain-containing protein